MRQSLARFSGMPWLADCTINTPGSRFSARTGDVVVGRMRPAAIGVEPIPEAVIAADVVATAGEQDAAPPRTVRGAGRELVLEVPREHLAERAPRSRDVLEVGVLRLKERLKPVDDRRLAGVIEPGIPLRQEVEERTLLSRSLGGVERRQLLARPRHA